MCPYVRNTRYMVLFMTIYTDQKLEKNPLMVVSEQSERAEIFALLRQEHMFFLYRPEKPENLRKSYTWLRASHFFVCVSETCDSSQYFVGESHSLSVQCVLLFVTLVIWSYSWRFIPTRNVQTTTFVQTWRRQNNVQRLNFDVKCANNCFHEESIYFQQN